MYNKNVPYLSVSQAIEDAIAKFKRKESIEDCLSWINGDTDRLTVWAYETETFFNEDYVFLTSEDEIFITGDNLLECFDIEQLDLTEDEDISCFIDNRVHSVLEYQDGPAAHYYHTDGVCLAATCISCGQAGLHFCNFDIYNSKEDYYDCLKEQGSMLWMTKFVSHSDEELISMYKQNVTNKYFPK